MLKMTGNFLILVRCTLGLLGWTALTVAQEPTFDWAIKLNHYEPNGEIALSADSAGDVFLTDSIYGQGTGPKDLQIIKLGRNGAELWSRQFSGVYLPCCASARTAVGPDGSLYVAGAASTNAFRGSTIKPSGEGRAFILKIGASGDVEWIRLQGGGAKDIYSKEVVVDASANYYIAGWYVGHPTIGGQSLPATADPETRNAFVAKFNPAGTLQWVRTAENSGGISGLSLDSAANVFISGAGGPGTTLDQIAFEDSGFVAKFSPSGELIWAQPNSLDATSLAADPSGNVYVSNGTFEGEFVLRKFSPTGEIWWEKVSSGGVNVRSVATDAHGNCFIVGYYKGSAYFDNFLVESIGNFDMCVAKYAPNGDVRWALSTTATLGVVNNMISVCDTRDPVVTIDPAGRCYVAAQFRGPVKYSSILLSGPTTAGGWPVAVARISDPDNPIVESPLLRIRRLDKKVLIAWPISSSGFTLEHSDQLGPNANWTPVAETPVAAADENVVSTVTPDAVKFFRLKRP